MNGRTVASVALQLRILWACLRWDDMAIDPSVDGRIITNTDTGTVSTKILNRRIHGRFLERVEYLRLKEDTPHGYADWRNSKKNFFALLTNFFYLFDCLFVCFRNVEKYANTIWTSTENSPQKESFARMG